MHEPDHPDATPASGGNGARGLHEVGFSYEVDQGDGRVVVSMQGELDLAAAPELQRELLAIVGRPVTALTLHLGGVTFLDSSGLGALYRTRQAAEEQGIPMLLDAVPDHVMRVLDVTAMASLFDLDPRTA